jgi:hypothetical protein
MASLKENLEIVIGDPGTEYFFTVLGSTIIVEALTVTVKEDVDLRSLCGGAGAGGVYLILESLGKVESDCFKPDPDLDFGELKRGEQITFLRLKPKGWFCLTYVYLVALTIGFYGFAPASVAEMVVYSNHLDGEHKVVVSLSGVRQEGSMASLLVMNGFLPRQQQEGKDGKTKSRPFLPVRVIMMGRLWFIINGGEEAFGGVLFCKRSVPRR